MSKDNVLYLRRDKQRKSDKHPEFRGSGVVFGREVWISAYLNDGDDGKYFKINVTEKDANNTRKPAASPKEDFDDTIPFGFAILAPIGLALVGAVHFATSVVA